MIIGIDFDNTIACYDRVFEEVARLHGFIEYKSINKSKIELRDFLLQKPGGMIEWMKLQGMVYGRYMHRAELMPMVANFLLRCKARSEKVLIISHKTKFGHYDLEKIPLRKEAKKWMISKRFFDPLCFGLNSKDVYFASTPEEKVDLIDKLNCDVFIDDLFKIFRLAHFPKNTEKILFDRSLASIDVSKQEKVCKSWSQISDYLFGNISIEDIFSWVQFCSDIPVKKIDKKVGRANSQIYRIRCEKKVDCVVKIYPDKSEDNRERVHREFSTINLLKNNGFSNIPETILMNQDLSMGIYSWVDGVQIHDPTNEDLEQAVQFIKQLHSLSRTSEVTVGQATEACLSYQELLNQIEYRLDRLLNISKECHELNIFLRDQFIPLWEKVKLQSSKIWPKSSKDSDLDIIFQTWSPSDFGFHNAIKSQKKIYFIDFEYFGWDDPVKLTADFIWHPGMKLSSDLVNKWREAMLELFYVDPDFEIRLEASFPLYGLRWTLIILNGFLPNFVRYRHYITSSGSDVFKRKQSAQLEKSIEYCENIKTLIGT